MYDVSMGSITARVVQRYLKEAFKYQPKEKKENKVKRLVQMIREETGLSSGQAKDIASAVVRGRDIDALALQKGWPIEDGVIEGPKGHVPVKKIEEAV
jgi:hypothetical protein